MIDKDFNIVAQNDQSTVVSIFTPSLKRSENYQSEDELEKEFIAQLQAQAYEYLKITKEDDLKLNLRIQLEKLNKYKFTNNEWNQFFDKEIGNKSLGIEEKTKTIQEDYIKNLIQENGTVKNIKLIDKEDIHNNSVQVINQYTTEDGKRGNRYDVTILVNGLPLVHIELKRRGVDLKEAFNQINRYQRESFWSSSGLFEYVQIFVISNGTLTKYYSNTTRFTHIKEKDDDNKLKKTSNSFEFTIWWADYSNNIIADLMDFSKTFFSKHSLLNILTKYCVFTTDKSLLVMRPYQIVATEKIINKIEISSNYKKYGSIDAGGYVWHTTGSGKTLTSFKTAQLASKLTSINKVVFIVDRKDLDYQTMKEYDKFEKGAANSNKSTKILKSQLEDTKSKIIITTIQKLYNFIQKNKGHNIFNDHVVLIFDECHRSQFGDMQKAIKDTFKKYHIFGFTGTPIFAVNSSSGSRPDLKTTEQTFGDKLHTYTIVNAINDKTVLPFKIDYMKTLSKSKTVIDKKVTEIDKNKAWSSPQRIKNIVTYIIEHFDQKTIRTSSYSGFNSIFAVSSIDMAKLYYSEFKKQLKNLPHKKPLKVATIFSFGANEEEADGLNEENSEDTSGLDISSQDFLSGAIVDYNSMFGTSYDTSSEQFQNYYKDVSDRVKKKEIDILIVVNMFLTGFDSTTLNTLWVDKNLKSHGLIQAFSRTNRILNSIKTFGNIVCFRNLEQNVNEAIALFGDKEACGIVLLKTFNEYYNGYKNNDEHVKGYKELVKELQDKFPVNTIGTILGEKNQKDFVRQYGSILRVRNILNTFDEFNDKGILTERDLQDYKGKYLSLYNEFNKTNDNGKENINDDLVWEIELMKQTEINVDYIITLIEKYHNGNCKDKEIITDIYRSIDSSFKLYDKKDLIEKFIQSQKISQEVDWKAFVKKEMKDELNKIIKDEDLDPDKTHKFIKEALKDGSIPKIGTSIAKLFNKKDYNMSRFNPNDTYNKINERVFDKLTIFLKKFLDT